MIFLPPLASTLKEEGALAREGTPLTPGFSTLKEGLRLTEAAITEAAMFSSAFFSHTLTKIWDLVLLMVALICIYVNEDNNMLENLKIVNVMLTRGDACVADIWI